MKEQRPREAPMELTADYRYQYRGLNSDGGVCHLRVYQAPGRTPVVVATELPDNPNSSVTNAAEYLAADVVARHFPARFDEDEPVIWVEHYPVRPGAREEFDRVSFARNVPKPERVGGVWRRTLGEPEWRPLGREALERLIGQRFPDIPTFG
jgi:hypothetical protein